MSSTTTNIGLTKMATGETIGQWSDANNGSGGNLDIIDTKMGPVGATSLQAQINALSSQLAGFDGNRMASANRTSISAIIAAVTATANNSISIVGTNTSVGNSLGGGGDSCIMLCKYFSNDNIINYVIIGRQITIGKINTSTEEVTIVKQYA